MYKPTSKYDLKTETFGFDAHSVTPNPFPFNTSHAHWILIKNDWWHHVVLNLVSHS